MTLPRRLVLALAAGALSASAAGCGAPTADAPDDAPSGSGAADADFPVTLESEFGTTEITERPERVVVLGLIDADPVLALGVTPVALQQWLPQYAEYGVGPWAEDLVAAAVDSGETEVLPNPGVIEVDVEQVAALEPDLVVAISANIDQQVFDQLSQVAPVVARPPGSVNFGVPFTESTPLIGRALGLEDEADALVTETQQLFADAAAANREFDGATLAMARPVEGGWSPWLAADIRVQTMGLLGFEQAPGLVQVDDGKFSTTISSERLDLLDADALVVVLPQGFEDAVANDAVLQQLPVVARGDIVELDAAGTGGALSYGSVLSANTVVDDLVPQLAEVVGD